MSSEEEEEEPVDYLTCDYSLKNKVNAVTFDVAADLIIVGREKCTFCVFFFVFLLLFLWVITPQFASEERPSTVTGDKSVHKGFIELFPSGSRRTLSVSDRRVYDVDIHECCPEL